PWTNENIREEIRGAFEIASSEMEDADKGYLTSHAVKAELAAAISEQPVRLVVAELGNSASIRNVVGETNFSLVTESIAKRCGNVLVRHGLLSRDLFVFAIACEDADQTLDLISESLAQPATIAGQKISMEVFLGYVDSAVEDDCDESIRKATIALTTLDKNGGIRIAAYCKSSESNLHLRHTLEHDMHRALERREFFVLIQPQVDARTLKICGGEALVRWQHPTHGLISPLQFIDQAERSGFIHELGAWVIQRTLSVAREMQAIESEDLRVSVNVSPRQFQQGFDAPWVQLLEQVASGEPELLKHLELEITESTVMDDPAVAAVLIERLSKLGLSIALDDFGTGHSSLSQLNTLPIDILKIDRSLIADVTTNERSRKLVTHLTSMCKDLGFKIVAEGLEESGQIEFCQASGCDQLQGFAFHKPLPVDEFVLRVIEEQLVRN
ncbi:MAG: EAL domain-containing protein, partial [Pseudomonadota bacterium]